MEAGPLLEPLPPVGLVVCPATNLFPLSHSFLDPTDSDPTTSWIRVRMADFYKFHHCDVPGNLRTTEGARRAVMSAGRAGDDERRPGWTARHALNKLSPPAPMASARWPRCGILLLTVCAGRSATATADVMIIAWTPEPRT